MIRRCLVLAWCASGCVGWAPVEFDAGFSPRRDASVGGFDASVGDSGLAEPVDSGTSAVFDASVRDASVSETDAGLPARLDAGAPPDAGFSCPTAPPADLSAPGLEACTEPVLVALGNRSRRAVSFDGTTWLDDQLDDGNCFGGNCYDDGAFQAAFGLGYIVTASDFGIFTSADRGHTWVKAPAPAPQKWGEGVHVSDVVFTGKRFVVFSDTTAFTSTDAFTWVKHTIALSGSHVAFGAVAVTANGRILASAGTTSLNVSDHHRETWQAFNIGATFKSLATNGATVVVGVGTDVWGVSIDNGDHWSIFADDCGLNQPARCVKSTSTVLFVDGAFTFTGNGNVLSSTNGKDWAKVGNGTGYDWVHVRFAGQDFGVGYPGDKYLTGPTAGGPWQPHVWPGPITEGVLGLSVGRVLKR